MLVDVLKYTQSTRIENSLGQIQIQIQLSPMSFFGFWKRSRSRSSKVVALEALQAEHMGDKLILSEKLRDADTASQAMGQDWRKDKDKPKPGQGGRQAGRQDPRKG